MSSFSRRAFSIWFFYSESAISAAELVRIHSRKDSEKGGTWKRKSQTNQSGTSLTSQPMMEQTRKKEHRQRYFFLMVWPYVAVGVAALEILRLTHSYNNPTSSPIIGFLWFLAVAIPVSWTWQIRLGRPYREWLKNHPRRRTSDRS